MRVLVLSAGYGIRMRPLTAYRPKPLLQICNRPLLGFHLARLGMAGVKRAYINRHYGVEAFPSAQWWRETVGLDVTYLEESPAPFGTGGAVRRLAHQEGPDHVLVMNADSLHTAPLSPFLQEPPVPAVAALLVRRVERSFYRPLGWNPNTGLIDPTGVPPGHLPVMFAGTAWLSRKLVESLPDEVPSDWFQDALVPMFRRGANVIGVHSEDPWWDFGHADTFFDACSDLMRFLARGDDAVRAWGPWLTSAGTWVRPGVFAHPSATIEDTVEFTDWAMIGEGCVLEGGARIGGAVLEAGVRIRGGRVNRAYVLQHTVLSGFHVEQALALEEQGQLRIMDW